MSGRAMRSEKGLTTGESGAQRARGMRAKNGAGNSRRNRAGSRGERGERKGVCVRFQWVSIPCCTTFFFAASLVRTPVFFPSRLFLRPTKAPPPWSPGKRRAAGYPAHPSPILLQITSPMHAPRLGQMSSSSTRPQENYRPGRLLTHAQSRPDDGRRPSPHLVRPLVRRRPH